MKPAQIFIEEDLRRFFFEFIDFNLCKNSRTMQIKTPGIKFFTFSQFLIDLDFCENEVYGMANYFSRVTE